MFEGIAFCLDALFMPIEGDRIPRIKAPEFPHTVEEAFARDWKKIGDDMYAAIDKVTGNGEKEDK